MFSRDRESEDKLNRSTMFRRSSRRVKFFQARDHKDHVASGTNSSTTKPPLSKLRTSRAQQARDTTQSLEREDLAPRVPSSTDSAEADSTSFLSSSATDASPSKLGKATYTISNTETLPPGKTRYTINARDDLHSNAPPTGTGSNLRFNEIRNIFEAEKSARLAAPTPYSTPQYKPASTDSLNAEQLAGVETPAPSPPNLNLKLSRHDSVNVGTESQSRRRSRTMTIDSATIRKIQSCDIHAIPRSLSQSRRGPPPCSFPHTFYTRGHTDDEARSVDPTRLPPSRQPSTRSTSPRTIVRSSDTCTSKASSAPTSLGSKNCLNFHSTVHHFTSCPHSSPPATRPLDSDSQPRLSPQHRPSSTCSEPTRSVIPGSCVNCDTISRRSKEHEIINGCTDQLIALTHRLNEMAEELEIVDSVYYANDNESSKRQRLTQFYASRSLIHLPISDDDPTPLEPQSIVGPEIDAAYIDALALQIAELEDQIETLRGEQDGMVKQVWKGFTRRWGIGTLGIQRGGYHSNPLAYITLEDEAALEEQREQRLNDVLDPPTSSELATNSPEQQKHTNDGDGIDVDVFAEHAKELARASGIPPRSSSRGRRPSPKPTTAPVPQVQGHQGVPVTGMMKLSLIRDDSTRKGR